MNFNLSEEQKALQNSVRKFARTELPEIAKQIEDCLLYTSDAADE